MKALVYKGPRDVSVVNVPDAKIEKPTDVLVKITTTNICGSDLHMYEGRTSVEKGKVLGHENLGVVIEAGPAVQRVKVGDHVCLPFNVACGYCDNCERGLTGFCLTANPGSAGAAYGYAEMGPYSGGQAEFLRVPWADFNCLVLPKDAAEKENDYVMLSDIFPTGYHATEMAGVKPGDSVVIFGAGPVGLMATHSAMLRGASKVMVVDMHKDRLALAEKLGAIAIDSVDASCVERVMELTGGLGADCGCECVGYQCHDHPGHEVPNLTMNNLVKSVRAAGRIGVVGVFMPEDPGRREQLNVFGNDYPTPDGTGVRDYIHVVDLALGHVAALNRLFSNEGSFTVNLGTGRGYSVLEAVKAFEAASGKPVPYAVKGRRPGDIAACYSCPDLAFDLLGWRAQRDLTEMCRDHWRWQSENPQGFTE